MGGSLKVSAEAASTSTVMFEGDTDLAFGFVAIELSAGERGNDGEIDLVFRPVKSGAVSFSIGGQPLVVADFEGALDVVASTDPANLGET